MKTTTNKTTAKITDEQLRSLIEESAQAGDHAQIDLARAALKGNKKARRECARVVAAAAAMVD